MSTLQQIIQAIKNLNFIALEELLDDEKSYMDVPKHLFLDKLKEGLQASIDNGLSLYKEILKGTCGHCNKGCPAYSFTAEGYPSLDLFFEHKNGDVLDIYLCNKFIHKNSSENQIYFNFFEEDKVTFEPSEHYLISVQRSNEAVEHLKNLTASGLIYLEDLKYWHNRYKNHLKDTIGFNFPFSSERYKAFLEFDDIFYQVSNLVDYTKNYSFSKQTLNEYNKLLDEKELVQWLFKHTDSDLHANFTGTKNWKKTGFIKFDEDSDIIVDCHDYIDAFILASRYSKNESKLLDKYSPTPEHHKQYPDGISLDLKTFLKLHKKYLDILPEK